MGREPSPSSSAAAGAAVDISHPGLFGHHLTIFTLVDLCVFGQQEHSHTQTW